MNKTQMITEVAAKAGITKVQAAAAVDAVFGSITDALAHGDKVQLVGFGTFAPKYRAARECRNPKTAAKIKVPASYHPSFSAGKSLKEVVAKYKG